MTRLLSSSPGPTDLPSADNPSYSVVCDQCGETRTVRMKSDLPLDWGALVEHESLIVHYCGPCMEDRQEPSFMHHSSPLACYFRSDKLGALRLP